MSLLLRPYTPTDSDAWDSYCERAIQATFLHTRRFLSYHGDRFRDQSLIIEDGGRWVGILPAAEHPADQKSVVSHPGITYGAFLHQGSLRGESMVCALELACQHYAALGYTKLIYKMVPAVYHQAPAQDDSYAMFRCHASRVRCDLSSAINLHNRLPVSERRKRSLKKAKKAGIQVVEGPEYLPALWKILVENLASKHNAQPVHSLDEITLLVGRFPYNIHCVCALLESEIVAGTLIFATPTCNHAQYIASSELGYSVSALDAVFAYCINSAEHAGKTWFDFGISNEQAGTYLNDGLYRFKTEFGGGGIVHEFFEIAL